MDNRQITKRYRIYSGRRFTLFIVTVLATLTMLGYLIFAVTSSAQEKTTYDKVIVRSGDTIWDIAKEHVKGDYNIRHAVKAICQANGLNSAVIYPGQMLMIPESVD